MSEHFDQTPRRRAEFVRPPNLLKSKVGAGGLSEEILARAQETLERNSLDFHPLADMYLTALSAAIDHARGIRPGEDHESYIVAMLYPTMQLKANGGMFHYPLVTQLAHKQVQFLEVIEKIDPDVIELILAFMTSIQAIMAGQITSDGGPRGRELVAALDEACRRYFHKNPDSDPPEDSPLSL